MGGFGINKHLGQGTGFNSPEGIFNSSSAFKINHSFLFDGVNERFTLPNADINSVVSGSNNFSIFTYIYINNLSGGSGIMGNTVTSNGRSSFTFFATNTGKLKLQTYLSGFPSMITNISLSTGNWYRIWAVVDKSTPSNNKIYIDTVSKSLSGNSLTTFGNESVNFSIGSIDYNANNQPLNGYINQLAIINRTITQAEIINHDYNGNPLSAQQYFGTDCKMFMNADNSTDTAQFNWNDNVNSITATSVNMETADKTTTTPY